MIDRPRRGSGPTCVDPPPEVWRRAKCDPAARRSPAVARGIAGWRLWPAMTIGYFRERIDAKPDRLEGHCKPCHAGANVMPGAPALRIAQLKTTSRSGAGVLSLTTASVSIRLGTASWRRAIPGMFAGR